mgnify:CR=1 FL=1
MNSLHKKIVYILEKKFHHYVQINEEELSKIDNDEANYLIKRSKVCSKRSGLFCKKLLELGAIDFIEIQKHDIDRSKTKQERYKIKKKDSGKVICSFYVDKALKDDFGFFCDIVHYHAPIGSVLTKLMLSELEKNKDILKRFKHLKKAPQV